MSTQPPRQQALALDPATASLPTLAALLPGPLVFVLGKGGVGKSMIAAVLGRLLAASGRRTLLLEVDARESLHELLGVAPSGGDIETVEERLWLESARPRRMVDRQIEARLPFEMVRRRLFAHPVYEHFVAGAPGLEEVAALRYAQEQTLGVASDAGLGVETVVLDAPATGHGIAMLAAPRLVAEVIRSGPFGHMAHELADLLIDGARCQLVVVTQAEEMPVEETFDLRRELATELGLEPRLLVINALAVDGSNPGTARSAVAAVASADEPPAMQLWRRRQALQARHLERLRRDWAGRRVELPLLPLERGPGLVAELARRLVAGLAGAGT